MLCWPHQWDYHHDLRHVYLFLCATPDIQTQRYNCGKAATNTKLPLLITLLLWWGFFVLFFVFWVCVPFTNRNPSSNMLDQISKCTYTHKRKTRILQTLLKRKEELVNRGVGQTERCYATSFTEVSWHGRYTENTHEVYTLNSWFALL